MRNGEFSLIGFKNSFLSNFFLYLSSLSLWFAAFSTNVFAKDPQHVWTDDRLKSVVRIELKVNKQTLTGTGVIVTSSKKDGKGHNFQYIITSRHVVQIIKDAGNNLRDPHPTNCEKDLDEEALKIYEGQSGDGEITIECVIFPTKDIALIRVDKRDKEPYPALDIIACAPREGVRLYIAGFALSGYRDIYRHGIVTSYTPENVIVDVPTAGGMSGGAYLTHEGHLVGIHQGAETGKQNFAYMKPLGENMLDDLSKTFDINGDKNATCSTPPSAFKKITDMDEDVSGKFTNVARIFKKNLDDLKDEKQIEELAKLVSAIGEIQNYIEKIRLLPPQIEVSDQLIIRRNGEGIKKIGQWNFLVNAYYRGPQENKDADDLALFACFNVIFKDALTEDGAKLQDIHFCKWDNESKREISPADAATTHVFDVPSKTTRKYLSKYGADFTGYKFVIGKKEPDGNPDKKFDKMDLGTEGYEALSRGELRFKTDAETKKILSEIVKGTQG